jgi:TetR/AcrR family transcriptional regulator, regulator of cefoperazone and chloramphenicol sensitivity
MAASHVTNDRPLEDLTTRARIRDAAMAEFAEKGYRGATMRGIAAAAGVSVGLVQHHFGTKDGLRAACDELVLDQIRFKMQADEDGTIGDPQVLASLMAMAPPVQRYVGRALVDGSDAIGAMVDQVMTKGEEFLTSWWPDRFAPGTRKTREAAAVMIAINTSTMVLQDHVARRIGVEPFSETALARIGLATLDVWEAIGALVDSDMWRGLRAAVETYTDDREE